MAVLTDEERDELYWHQKECNLSAIELSAAEQSARTAKRGNGHTEKLAADFTRFIEAPVSEPPGRLIDWPALVGQSPPDREWIIPHWIPSAHVTLLAGRGGIGKSLLAQHIGASLACGTPYLEALAPKRVLMWAAEDDHDELWRRQLAISAALHLPQESLSGFTLRSCTGCDVTLAAPVFSSLAPAPLMMLLREECSDLKAELVILDNIARIFGGNENDRHQVTTFIAWIQSACAPAAVLLLGHPGRAKGSEFSGSSAWEGAVRARLYFGDRPPDEEEGPDFEASANVRFLARRKSNYSELDLRKFTLDAGALLPEGLPQRTSFASNPVFYRHIVSQAIERLAQRSIDATASTASPNYLPKLAKQYELLGDATERMFTAAMRQMILDGVIVTAKVGSYGNRTQKMALTVAQMDTHK